MNVIEYAVQSVPTIVNQASEQVLYDLEQEGFSPSDKGSQDLVAFAGPEAFKAMARAYELIRASTPLQENSAIEEQLVRAFLAKTAELVAYMIEKEDALNGYGYESRPQTAAA
jgi:hypothetical protein